MGQPSEPAAPPIAMTESRMSASTPGGSPSSLPEQWPFHEKPFQSPGFFLRLFRRRPKANAIIEVNNLLAGGVRALTPEAIAGIEARYDVNLRKAFREQREAFYRDVLLYCLRDKHLSESDTADLGHVKRMLGLDDQAVRAIHETAASTVYQEAIQEALADRRLSEEERAFLDRLESEVSLPAAVAQSLWAKSATDCVANAVKAATSDARLSPEEDAEIEAIGKSLHVTLDADEKTRGVLEKYRLFWRIENGDLPQIDSGINLTRGEVCHHAADVQWYETRRVTRRIRYGGPTMRLRIMKGLYWSAGDVAVQPVSEDVMTLVDTGRVFITNKRLIFMGGKKNTSIRLNKILDFTPYKNGVQTEKDAGKSPFLGFEQGVDVFSMILGKAIENQS